MYISHIHVYGYGTVPLNNKIYLSIYSSIYPIYQPLRSGRIWHKVNFLSGI